MRKTTRRKMHEEQQESRKFKRELVPRYMKLPKDFGPTQATPGTRAFEYINLLRSTKELIDDPELLMIIDDKDPAGGLLYVFKDHSSVVHIPTTH